MHNNYDTVTALHVHVIVLHLEPQILHLQLGKSDSIVFSFLELYRISYYGFIIKNVCRHHDISLPSGQVKASGKDRSVIV